MIERRCESCVAFDPFNKFTESGFCHHNPPDSDGNFPQVHKSDWCMQFQSKYSNTDMETK